MTTFEPYYSDDTWHLIHCKSKKEQFAAHMLKRYLDLSVFFPELKVCFPKKMQKVPFFPGYIFVQVNLLKVPLSQINATPGVLRIVDFGGGPQIVPRHVVEEIAERLKQMEMPAPPRFQPGDVVRIKDNELLRDLEMIFVGPVSPSQRVNVLLSILGQSKEMRVDVEKLEMVRPKA